MDAKEIYVHLLLFLRRSGAHTRVCRFGKYLTGVSNGVTELWLFRAKTKVP
jgi:hypothetical protein